MLSWLGNSSGYGMILDGNKESKVKNNGCRYIHI